MNKQHHQPSRRWNWPRASGSSASFRNSPSSSAIPRSRNATRGTTIEFIRRIKRLNPDAEIIVQHYMPTPHPDGMYGNIDGEDPCSRRLPEEWASRRWYNFTVRQDPLFPGCPQRIKRRIDNFELVINSRWPTVQDIHLPRWSRLMLQSLSSWRYASGLYAAPFELGWAQKLVALRKPRWESI